MYSRGIHVSAGGAFKKKKKVQSTWLFYGKFPGRGTGFSSDTKCDYIL